MEVNGGAQDGDGSGAGTGAGVETRRRTPYGNGNGTEARTVAEMGTRIGSGRAEERRRSARNRKIAVGAMWETEETWVERGKNVEKKGLVQ